MRETRTRKHNLQSAWRPSRWIVVLAAFALWAVFGVAAAEGSHFRYGHYNWAPTGATSIDFTVQNAFRRSGYSCIDTTTGGSTPCTPPDGFPGTGDAFTEFVGGTFFAFGDSGSTGTLSYVVTSTDPPNDWLFGLALDPASLPGPPTDTQLGHAYGATGDYLAFTDSCCRIGNNINNSNGGYRVETIVNVGTQAGNRSPVSNLPPIVSCPINALCSFQVPGSDPDGDVLNYRLSTPAEASTQTAFVQPGPPYATNAASISATGLYTWDTTGATLAGSGPTYYSTQVTIEDRDGANAVKSKVALDFLIQLVAVVGNPPVFDSPPTPGCGSTQSTTVGGTLTFTVQASDPDMGDIVTLNAAGLPPGATMTPPLPTSGNPVSSQFSWTPGAPGTFVVTFSATDQTGQQVLCSITVEAQAAPNACGSSPNPPCLIEIRPRSMFLNEPVGADNCVGLTINILQGKVSDGTAGVRWLTVAGTAKPTHDYDSAGAVVTFPAGTNALPITVCINDDNVTEPRESFTVQLVNPVNAVIEAPGQKSTIYINSNTN